MMIWSKIREGGHNTFLANISKGSKSVFQLTEQGACLELAGEEEEAEEGADGAQHQVPQEDQFSPCQDQVLCLCLYTLFDENPGPRTLINPLLEV